MSSKKDRTEVPKEIVAIASVVIKLGAEGEIFDSQHNFVEFLNECGVRTTHGKELTKMNFRQMFGRLSPNELSEVMAEFDAQRDFDLFAKTF